MQLVLKRYSKVGFKQINNPMAQQAYVLNMIDRELKPSESCFSLSRKMNSRERNRASSLNAQMLRLVSPYTHKDSISRFTEAISRFKENKKLPPLLLNQPDSVSVEEELAD
jgi:transposase-like protein